MVKVRVLVRVVSFLRSRERAFLSDDVVVPFRLKTMKREQQKTPNDARQKRSRGDATGKSRPRGHAKTASAFIDDIFSSDDETIKARSAHKTRFSETSLQRRFWVGIPDGGVSGPLVLKQELTFICISLSLSRNNRFKNTQHRLGKPKSRSRRRRKSRNTRATSSACGPSSPACSARCCPSRCKCAGINTGLYRKNLSANLNTATRRMSRTRRIRAGCIHGLRRNAR